jgi:hypothetical protein
LFLIRRKLYAELPCVRLSDGTGIWFVLGDPTLEEPVIYCPLNQPGTR